MKTHHRIPSVFNLSMVDVLCCALGCVILLWLLNLRVAKEKAEEAGDSNLLLAATRSQRDRLQDDLDRDGKQLTAQFDQIQALEKNSKALADQAKDLEARLQQTVNELLASRENEKTTKEKLQLAEDRIKSLGALAEMVPGLRTKVKDLKDKLASEEALTKVLQGDLERGKQSLAAAGKDMQELKTTRRKLEEDLAARDKALAEAKMYREQLARAEDKLRTMDQEMSARVKELTTAERIIVKLQGEKKDISAQAERVRAAAENRFEGIALTGKRVVFLVDMSGSMELIDENTQAPNKWSGVRDTVVRIMKSLPDLEKYQVVIFSEKSTHLLGRDGAWLDYDPQKSLDQVSKALSDIKPKGGTNMYSALEAAFRYRVSGLDTIYLLSDGLPNLGAGLTAEQERTLKESEQGEILGKYIRKALKTDWNRSIKGQRVRINTVGFFFESPDVGAFLWALARENDGSFVGMSKP
ncbi:MAG TPA: VWA domain-containing protein [Gemmataceae bacterium]|nr:VWA domain-containing protein [Gemmataceae bacterium]